MHSSSLYKVDTPLLSALGVHHHYVAFTNQLNHRAGDNSSHDDGAV